MHIWTLLTNNTKVEIEGRQLSIRFDGAMGEGDVVRVLVDQVKYPGDGQPFFFPSVFTDRGRVAKEFRRHHNVIPMTER